MTRAYTIVDNLQAHRASDMLLFCLAYPQWEFVSQPKYAAYLNLIESWWKKWEARMVSCNRKPICHGSIN